MTDVALRQDPKESGSPLMFGNNIKPKVVARELRIQLASTRTWTLLFLPGLVAVAITAFIVAYGNADPEMVGTGFTMHPVGSGFAYPFVAMNTERFFILPLIVAMFAGETLAGEASWGSLRYILASPVSRKSLFATKTAVSAMEMLAAIVLLPALSLMAGIMASGAGPLQVLNTGAPAMGASAQASFSVPAALGALAGGTGLIAVSMLSTFSFALFLSAFTNQPFIPVAGGVGLLMVSRAIANIPGLSVITPLLPTAYGIHWADVLSANGPGVDVLYLVIIQVVWCIVLVSTAAWHFTRQDISW